MAILNPPAWTRRQAAIPAPRRRDDLIEEELDGQVVLYEPVTQRMHRLNETALHVWRSCDGRTTTRQIAGRLAERFEVDIETALDDVEQVMVLLAEEGLVRPAKEA